MNICSNKIVAVPETGLKYEVRIDLVKATMKGGQLGWKAPEVFYLASDEVKIGETRFIVSIQGVTPTQLDHGGCTSLLTKSRIAATRTCEVWIEWANAQAWLQNHCTLSHEEVRRHFNCPVVGGKKIADWYGEWRLKLPSHTTFWNL